MGTHQLIDPCGKSSGGQGKLPYAIAQWDTRHEKAYFFSHGFLFVNPNNPAAYRFGIDPNINPFLEEGGTPKPVKKGSQGGPQSKTKAAILAYTIEFDPTQYLDDASDIIKVQVTHLVLATIISRSVTALKHVVFVGYFQREDNYSIVVGKWGK